MSCPGTITLTFSHPPPFSQSVSVVKVGRGHCTDLRSILKGHPALRTATAH